MSALGQKQTLRRSIAMSALPPKADMAEARLDSDGVVITPDLTGGPVHGHFTDSILRSG
jgi:hypothetical protein